MHWGRNLEDAVINLTTTNLRSVIGSMDLDETLSNRQRINDVLMNIVDEATNPWGIKIIRIEIRDLRMDTELQQAMNLQMIAERRRRAQVTEANVKREAEILQAEGEKQAAILRAEGQRQAAFLESEAREREAQAEAQATKVVSEAIAEGDIQAVQYFLGLKYVEALQNIGQGDNAKLVMLPLEAAGIAGAVTAHRIPRTPHFLAVLDFCRCHDQFNWLRVFTATRWTQQTGQRPTESRTGWIRRACFNCRRR